MGFISLRGLIGWKAVSAVYNVMPWVTLVQLGVATVTTGVKVVRWWQREMAEIDEFWDRMASDEEFASSLRRECEEKWGKVTNSGIFDVWLTREAAEKRARKRAEK